MKFHKRKTKLCFFSSKLKTNREENPNRKRHIVDEQTMDTALVAPGFVF